MTLTFVCTLLVSVTFAQARYTSGQRFYKNRFDYFIFDANVGSRIGKMKNSNNFTPSIAGLSANAGIGYMIDPKFGIRGGIEFDRASSTNDLTGASTASNILSFNAQFIANIIEIAGIRKKRIGLNAHAGLGISTMFNKDFDRTDQKFISTNDDMLHGIIGITPQIQLTNRMSVNIDFSFIMLGLSDSNIDFSSGHGGNFDNFMTTSVGLVYHTKDIKHYTFITKHN